VNVSLGLQPRGRIRPDGYAKVTGSGRYVADLSVPGMLHGAFRFAGVPHARIVAIDTAAARALPGVVAVITAADVGIGRHGLFVRDRTLFADGVVRWEGEVVAAVAARTAAIARRAAALIEITYEERPAVVELEAALAPGAPLVHEDWASYEVSGDVLRDGNEATRCSIVKGDAEAALAGAVTVVRSRYVADGSQPVPMEPRAVLAEWHGGEVVIHSSTQVPFAARAHVAASLGLSESSVRVVVPLLGGGFGGKCEPHFEPQVAALARAARRPVKVVFNRHEEFLAPDHRRERMILEYETGVDAAGHFVARRARLVVENGAYCADEPVAVQMAAHFAVGPYRVPHVEVRSHLVYTNTQPTGSVRAPAAPTVCWGLEQHLDEVAGAVGLDPVELRRRNLVRPGDTGATGQVYEQIGATECLERAARLIGYGLCLLAVVPHGLRCLSEAERRRVGHDRHGCPGERVRGRHGPSAARRPRARHGRRGLLARLPGHRRGALRRRLGGEPDDVQQRSRRARRRRGGRRSAARPGRRPAGGGTRGPRAGRRRGPGPGHPHAGRGDR
jgi:CO/xanthine dehydrogenase Mo-binding subunit